VALSTNLDRVDRAVGDTGCDPLAQLISSSAGDLVSQVGLGNQWIGCGRDRLGVERDFVACLVKRDRHDELHDLGARPGVHRIRGQRQPIAVAKHRHEQNSHEDDRHHGAPMRSTSHVFDVSHRDSGVAAVSRRRMIMAPNVGGK